MTRRTRARGTDRTGRGTKARIAKITIAPSKIVMLRVVMVCAR